MPNRSGVSISGGASRISGFIGGLILIALGLRLPLLLMAGVPTTGQIVSVTRTSSWITTYQFRDQNGQQQTGRDIAVNWAGQVVGDTRPVRYLAAWPLINAIDSDMGIIFSLAMVALGICAAMFSVPGSASKPKP